MGGFTSVNRDERRVADPAWVGLETALERALNQVEVNPAVAVRVEAVNEESALDIWNLLTDEEKTVTVVSWTTAHFLTRHPQWVALANPKPEMDTIT